MDTVDSSHNENTQYNTGSESRIKSNNSPPELPPVPTKPESQPSEACYAVTCKPEKNWWDKAKPFAEILGIFLLLVYTIYTIRMYYANKEAADAARDAAQTASRALKSSDDSFAKTLEQMKAQTAAQQDAANAARNSARAASDAACAMGRQVDKLQDEVNQISILAKAAEDVLGLQMHPWLGVDDPAPGDITQYIHGAVTFKLRLRNYGQSPALSVPMYLWFVSTQTKPGLGLFNVTKVCEHEDERLIDARTRTGSLDTIFPGQPQMLPSTVNVSPPDIEPFTLEESEIIVGCIPYYSLRGQLYHTRVIYKVSFVDLAKGAQSRQAATLQRLGFDVLEADSNKQEH